MIARIGRPARAVLCLPLVLVLAGVAPARRSPPPPSPPSVAYSPPPSEESPFSHPDQFCVPSDDQNDAATTSDPKVRAQPVEVVWLTNAAVDATASQDGNEIGTFARLVERCGGIGGRPLEVHVVHESGDAASDCAAVARFKPVAVVARDLPAASACVVHDQGTILITGAVVSNAELTGTSGRLVASGSSEGVDRARMLALVESGRLTGHKVAILADAGASGDDFRRATLAALATQRLRPVALADADTVLTAHLDPADVPTLARSGNGTPGGAPLDVYDLGVSDPSLPAALQAQPIEARRMLRTLRVFSFAPLTDPTYLATREPNAFVGMCNRAAADETARHDDVTTSTTEARPPFATSYFDIADVCLLTRIVARGLYAAGPSLDQRALVTALHRLPYVDAVVPAGTPKPRPNQVVNEPVRRIEQTVVLDQLGPDCPAATTSGAAAAVFCWSPAQGWDEGGMVVNTPLPQAAAVSH